MVTLNARTCIRCKSVWIKNTKLIEKQVALLNEIKKDPLLNEQIQIKIEKCSCVECKDTVGEGTMNTLKNNLKK